MTTFHLITWIALFYSVMTSFKSAFDVPDILLE
uniref:Uncharacterized protein n=1 Tax=Rhizophora mucronata TaxID=61149 RepID=A0A2P2QN81_RHIMU